MKINSSDRIIAWLALLSGLTISAVAIWYSVAGLVSIFSAAVIPIIVMGVALEISKLIATVWLKINWTKAPTFIRGYLLIAITILMIITSMGIFGFLSKAHSDQSLISGDVQAKLVLIDEKIRIERENIANSQQVIKQMDAAVNGVIATGDQEVKLRDGSTRVNSAAERSLQIRRQQSKDRAKLTKEIEDAQGRIIKLQEEAAPIRAENRKVEAEVGPIKYIAKFIYGDNPDANILEKAVTWVIIIIVSVFDPLAVILLLASQYSFQWFRNQKEEQQKEETVSVNDHVSQPTELIAEPEPEVEQPKETEPEKSILEQHPYLNSGESFWKKPEGWVSVGPMVAKPEEETTDEDILKTVEQSEKEAMKAWKKDNPNGSLKLQRNLLERGIINHLPWEEYLKASPDFTDKEAAEEAAKWALEQLETPNESQPTSNKIVTSWIEREGSQQIKKSIDDTDTTYIQNAEQGEGTIWQRVKKAKGE